MAMEFAFNRLPMADDSYDLQTKNVGVRNGTGDSAGHVGRGHRSGNSVFDHPLLIGPIPSPWIPVWDLACKRIGISGGGLHSDLVSGSHASVATSGRYRFLWRV